MSTGIDYSHIYHLLLSAFRAFKSTARRYEGHRGFQAQVTKAQKRRKRINESKNLLGQLVITSSVLVLCIALAAMCDNKVLKTPEFDGLANEYGDDELFSWFDLLAWGLGYNWFVSGISERQLEVLTQFGLGRFINHNKLGDKKGLELADKLGLSFTTGDFCFDQRFLEKGQRYALPVFEGLQEASGMFLTNLISVFVLNELLKIKPVFAFASNVILLIKPARLLFDHTANQYLNTFRANYIITVLMNLCSWEGEGVTQGYLFEMGAETYKFALLALVMLATKRLFVSRAEQNWKTLAERASDFVRKKRRTQKKQIGTDAFKDSKTRLVQKVSERWRSKVYDRRRIRSNYPLELAKRMGFFVLCVSWLLYECVKSVDKLDPAHDLTKWYEFSKYLALTGAVSYYLYDVRYYVLLAKSKVVSLFGFQDASKGHDIRKTKASVRKLN